VVAFRALIICLAVSQPTCGHTATASVYGGRDGYCGRPVASGGVLDCNANTAAHKTLPFGTFVRVTHGERSVVVRITDRGPYVRGREIDLAPAPARRIGCDGLCNVTLEVVPKPFVPTTRSAWGDQ
jgi:rare lipoprotein A